MKIRVALRNSLIQKPKDKTREINRVYILKGSNCQKMKIRFISETAIRRIIWLICRALLKIKSRIRLRLGTFQYFDYNFR